MREDMDEVSRHERVGLEQRKTDRDEGRRRGESERRARDSNGRCVRRFEA